MPKTVLSIKAEIRDHSMSIPVPENTIRHAIPNACSECHNKSAEWALQEMNKWYGEKSRQKYILRADAFTEARKGNPESIPSLLQILADPSGGPLIRANAAGYLGNFPNDSSAYAAVLQSFADSDPLVRATSELALRPAANQRDTVAREFVSLLKDPVTIVRMNAAVALVSIGVRQLPGDDGDRFESAKQLYRARAELGSDDADQQFAAGKFFYLTGEMGASVAAFRASLKLDGDMQVQFYLARSLAGTGDVAGARQILKAIAPNDPQYPQAQKLLAQMN
jgi:HEAT repeat protein